MAKTEAPPHLRTETQAWFLSVLKDYSLEPHHVRLLQLAAEAWDRAQDARTEIDRDGLTFRDDRGNIRPHPAIAIERDSRTGFARILRELDLDAEPPVQASRPPALRSNRG